MSRAEHLAWAKQRALEYVDRGEALLAMSSLASDFNKHDELRSHDGLTTGMKAQLGELITTADDVRGFIQNLH